MDFELGDIVYNKNHGKGFIIIKESSGFYMVAWEKRNTGFYQAKAGTVIYNNCWGVNPSQLSKEPIKPKDAKQKIYDKIKYLKEKQLAMS